MDEDFLDRGQLRNSSQFGSLSGKRIEKAHEDLTFPRMPPENEDVIWETWVPLKQDAYFLELQIWYPYNFINPGEEDRGYLFQMELDTQGSTSIDGLTATDLEVKSSSRAGFLTLEIAE
ncbi:MULTISPECIES: hypothetical protein [Pseudomonas syringae group]|uniref:hypothetical protein n=1 Tax=Pseudomonas syringae group TaxID=136849 RepID=UPI001E4545E5|nr:MULTISPECIES: hypothetical protein [Pseudomonas syringae group]